MNTSSNSNTISCGDERFPIIEKVLKGFEDDQNLAFPEEVEREEFVADADEYKYLKAIVTAIDKIKTKATSKKVGLGVKLADGFQTLHAHVTLKADKNDKYVDIAKDTAIFHNPNGKRKEKELVKKRNERSAKKNPPKA